MIETNLIVATCVQSNQISSDLINPAPGLQKYSSERAVGQNPLKHLKHSETMLPWSTLQKTPMGFDAFPNGLWAARHPKSGMPGFTFQESESRVCSVSMKPEGPQNGRNGQNEASPNAPKIANPQPRGNSNLNFAAKRKARQMRKGSSIRTSVAPVQ